MTIAIIGAGMAGLSCARMLADAGQTPVVFDKSRGLGGRLATRRAGDLRFDHGAQFVTARSDSFRAYLAQHAALWQPADAPEGWHVGAPAMNALVKPMADGLDIRLGEAVAPEREGTGWRIGDETFQQVISTVPVVQARALFPDMAEALAGVAVAPCYTLMVAFETAPDWNEMDRSRTDDLAFIARNSTKPGRETSPDCWVVHASPAWSEAHLELEKEAACENLLDLLRAKRGDLPPVTHAAAHRWRYAMTTTPLGRDFAAAEDGTLLIGGDWCIGARVEDAWTSGRAMAASILAR